VELEELEEAKRDYVKAKLAYEDRLRRLRELSSRIHGLLRRGRISLEEAMDRWDKAEDAVDTWEAYQELKRARERLLSVAKPMLMRRAGRPELMEAIEDVFSCRFPDIKERVAELILRWDPRR
jgi:exonuclease VII small subunit